jgi:phenylpropionate dioxygenase-like ring-hydroxylating dioxygenase large terminal subunit
MSKHERTGSMPSYLRSNAIFHDPEMFGNEMERIFREGWILAGTDDRLPGRETWFVHEDFERSIIVTRDASDRIHAFTNACRHRGTRLCGGPGEGRLKCPYHGWVYDCDGRLLGVAKRAGFPRFDDADHGLLPVQVESIGRFIFVRSQSDRPQTSKLREFLGPETTAMLENMSSLMHTLIEELSFDIEADWKFCVAGSIEDYHVPFVHPSSLEPARSSDSQPALYRNGHSYASVGVDPGAALRWLARQMLNREPAGHQDHSHVFPNVIVIHTWILLSVTMFVPKGPGRTQRITRLYDVAPQRSRLAPLGAVQKLVHMVARRRARFAYDEDVWICEEAQCGTLGSRDMTRGPAHVTEARVEHFLHSVAQRLGYGEYWLPIKEKRVLEAS